MKTISGPPNPLSFFHTMIENYYIDHCETVKWLPSGIGWFVIFLFLFIKIIIKVRKTIQCIGFESPFSWMN